MDCEKCKFADIIKQLKQDKTDLQEKVKKLNSDYDDLFKDNNYYVETIKAQKRQIDSLNNKLEDSANYQKILDLETKIDVLQSELVVKSIKPDAPTQCDKCDRTILPEEYLDTYITFGVTCTQCHDKAEFNEMEGYAATLEAENKILKNTIQDQDQIIIKLNDRIQELVTPKLITEEEKHTLKVLSSPVHSPPRHLIESPIIAKMQSMFDSPIGEGIPFNTMDRVPERMERNQTLGEVIDHTINELIDEIRQNTTFEDCEDIEPVYSE
jgi:hypothetical protein